MIVSALKCEDCGDIIFSRSRHDMRFCTCKKIAIDGGRDYIKVSWTDKIPKQIKLKIKQTNSQLYFDWNTRKDKYGIIKYSKKNICEK